LTSIVFYIIIKIREVFTSRNGALTD